MTDRRRLGDLSGLPVPTSREQSNAWRERRLPPVEEVRDRVWSLPLPLPSGNPMGYVNCYALLGDDGVALVDPGWDHEEGWQALRSGLSSFGASIEDVRDVLVTHFHADHYGLAPRVRSRSGARVLMHADDSRFTVPDGRSVDEALESITDFLLSCGAPADAISGLAQERSLIQCLRDTSGPDGILSPHSEMTLAGHQVEVLWTPGHTPGHVCFMLSRDGLLISGDHVLPRVSPNISVYEHSSRDPLGDFLNSLDLLGGRGVREVLPAHEYRFGDLEGRLDDLRKHHGERMAQLLDLLGDNGFATSWALSKSMSWSRSWDEMGPFTRRSANGEILAHLVQLERRGLAQRSSSNPQLWSTCVPDGADPRAQEPLR